jgi:hypothetical protein
MNGFSVPAAKANSSGVLGLHREDVKPVARDEAQPHSAAFIRPPQQLGRVKLRHQHGQFFG